LEKNEDRYLKVKWENLFYNEDYCSYVTDEQFQMIYCHIVKIFSKTINQETVKKLKKFMGHNQVIMMENIILRNQFLYEDRQHIIVLFMSTKEEIYLKVAPQEKKLTIIRSVTKNPTTKQQEFAKIIKK
jgi:hypothetical protein